MRVEQILNALLKNFGFCGLRISEIHHLVEQLINNDEVVSYTLLFELFEVFCEDLHDLVKEKEDLGGIGVALCQGKEVEVVVTDIEVLWQGLACSCWGKRDQFRTFMPSSEKHGGTADDSSSASDSNTGNFSTADIGMSPR